jgi:hypothetical protein
VNNLTTVISYWRFSSRAQRHGISLKRQDEAFEEYFATLGPAFVRGRQFEDRGVSGFRGDNSLKGALAELLRMIQAGEIPLPAQVVIESVDRLSRQKVMEAFGLFCMIISAGIEIVVLTQPRAHYTRANMDNIAILISTILEMARANGESERKSELSLKNWKDKRSGASVKKMTARGPGWLKLSEDRTQWLVIRELADVVERMFRLIIAGHGCEDICRIFNEERVPVLGHAKHWNPSSVWKLVRSKQCLGVLQPCRIERDEKGRERRTPIGDPRLDYYPAIIDEALWLEAQRVMDARSNRSAAVRRQGLVSNLFYPTATCDACGRHMIYRSKGGGQYPVLRCKAGEVKACPNQSRVRYTPFEEAFLDLITEIDIPAPAGQAQQAAGIMRKLGHAEMALADLRTKIARLIDLAEEGDPDIRERLKQRRQEKLELEQEIANLRVEQRAAKGSVSVPDRQAQLGAMRHLRGEEQTRARVQMQRLIAELVDQIRIEPDGTVTVIFCGGLVNYRFSPDLESVRKIDLRGRVGDPQTGLIPAEAFTLPSTARNARKFAVLMARR